MAKIKIKIGENEIEVDSRDFYIDNNTIGEVIENISIYLQGSDKNFFEQIPIQENREGMNKLSLLEDAEVHEPEFSDPILITIDELHGKLVTLSTNSFFDQPRTVSETVSELRENGWIASPLDVSKVLAKMAFCKELLKNKQDDRSFYFAKEALLAE